MSKILLESPVYTLEAALKGAEYGINRLELCADYGEGGTTPSAGLLAYIRSQINIPVFVMIRPRGGDFVYSAGELEVMKRDVRVLKSLGADGFVFGVLKTDGSVNSSACKELIQETEGLPCTFHKAIDTSSDLEEALESIIDCGFARILTSGGMDTVTSGLQTVKKLMAKAQKRIIVIPGGGTMPTHLRELHDTGYLKEVHSSCKTYRDSESTFFNPHLKLSDGEETVNKVLTIDKDIVEAYQREISELQ